MRRTTPMMMTFWLSLETLADTQESKLVWIFSIFCHKLSSKVMLTVLCGHSALVDEVSC